MKAVVGLGNPGSEYENTPHSLGHRVVEGLAGRYESRLRRRWLQKAHVGRAVIEGERALLVKPATYMNCSGPAVAAALKYEGVPPAGAIVVLDDADLEFGRLRIRKGGSSGGHKGLQSVIDSFGTEDFARIRLGVGRGEGADLAAHVLRRFRDAEKPAVEEMVRTAMDAAVCVLIRGEDEAMNRYNGKTSAAGGAGEKGGNGR